MSTATPTVPLKPWERRNPIVSLILAVLVPGLGHLFQGRVLKGLIYLFGILGLFVWGVKLGEGVVVYNLPEKGSSRRVTLQYAAQLCAGAIAYPALWQEQRATRDDNRPTRVLDAPLTAPFSGQLIVENGETHTGQLEGTVNFKSQDGEYGQETTGTFTGKLDGKPVELRLSGGFNLDRPIGAGFQRRLKCGVVGDRETPGSIKTIVGSIPRSIMNGYGVPPDPDQLQELTGRLGKLHELALVFTYIAGLLNVLAIWDCVQGPAYGMGDEIWPQSRPELNPVESKP